MSSNIPRSSWTAIEDNGQGTVINKLMAGGTIHGNTFESLVQIDNDQAAQIIGLDTNSGFWSLCAATYCSTAIVGAGVAGTEKNADGPLWHYLRPRLDEKQERLKDNDSHACLE